MKKEMPTDELLAWKKILGESKIENPDQTIRKSYTGIMWNKGKVLNLHLLKHP